jgi:putative Ca2+/H+ antiporter (TMEM165/GDT1 family)
MRPESASVLLSAFTLISVAEIGDKSQLVCMTLAAGHRPWPVLLGATLAFIIPNTLAVLFGAAVAAWVPERWTAVIVVVLFGVFGVNALLTREDEKSQNVE